MFKEELEWKGIKNKTVLEAMEKVPRDLFVPEQYKDYSYDDSPLPIGYGQTISQPFIVALMTEILQLNKASRVLEIGTGSGYQAAILAEIVKEVYTVEIIIELYDRASSILKQLGYKNINMKLGDGYNGWKEFSPYDAIIVTCASETVPKSFIEQLKIGGLMCIPIGIPFGVQDLLLIKKKKNDIETKVITQVRFVPMMRKKDKI